MILSREDIKALISESLADHGIAGADIRVQPDGYGGWRIAVVASQFEDIAPDIRQSYALGRLENIATTWVDLLSPSELEWAGPLPADVDPGTLPLWPETLGRSHLNESPAVFASDLDEDLSAPAVVTFYSLRGGVGRSTALVHTARLLASKGRKVVTVDMDLEAPGLASLMGVESQVRSDQGVVPLLTHLDAGEKRIDVANHLIRVSETDDLFCLPAGLPSADYARQLSLLDLPAWYREERNPLRELIALLREHLPFTPDFILIDSRTGISPISGPLLFDIADLAIIFFFPHPQAREGTRTLVQALSAARTQRFSPGVRLAPEPRFVASPVPGGENFDRYARRAREWVGDWIAPMNRVRSPNLALIEGDITHVIPYRESVASSDFVSRFAKDWSDFEPIAEWIERFASNHSTEVAQPSVASAKETVLAELQFPSGTAEKQEDLLQTFVETDAIKKALDPAIPLVRGRKGTGKTALFRLLSESGQHTSIKIVAPQSLQSGMSWTWGADGYRAVNELLNRTSAGWKLFWSFYICLRYVAEKRGLSSAPPDAVQMIDRIPGSEVDAVDAFEKFCGIPRRELIVGEWLRRIDREMRSPTLLLFDGLDTGFGNTASDRERRRAATEGLFGLLIDHDGQFEHLRLKVVLREDIWRQLRFENKSHLFGRDASLAWRNRDDFFKVVLVHARRSQAFRRLLSGDRNLANVADADLETWSSEAVSRAWTILIGERMKGSGTTYTTNWVWNRLADANDDRNPRYLLMLFHLVRSWEQRENARSKYDRSIIRPRSLEQSLPEVSKWALDALKEEFDELLPLLGLVTNERTPFPAELLDRSEVNADLLALAREVGLLGIYEERDGTPERYAVPEIYRLALSMKRRGQA